MLLDILAYGVLALVVAALLFSLWLVLVSLWLVLDAAHEWPTRAGFAYLALAGVTLWALDRLFA